MKPSALSVAKVPRATLAPYSPHRNRFMHVLLPICTIAIAAAAHARRPFATVTDLHAAMMGAVRAAPRDTQLAFLRNHPDLAGKAACAGAITDDSKDEQASAGLDTLPEEEFVRFHRLNDAYKAKFGFPFMVCVRRHTRLSPPPPGSRLRRAR